MVCHKIAETPIFLLLYNKFVDLGVLMFHGGWVEWNIFEINHLIVILASCCFQIYDDKNNCYKTEDPENF